MHLITKGSRLFGLGSHNLPTPSFAMLTGVNARRLIGVNIHSIWAGEGNSLAPNQIAQHAVKLLRLGALGTEDALAPSLQVTGVTPACISILTHLLVAWVRPPGGVKQCGRQLVFPFLHDLIPFFRAKCCLVMGWVYKGVFVSPQYQINSSARCEDTPNNALEVSDALALLLSTGHRFNTSL